MTIKEIIKPITWDIASFGIPCQEIQVYSRAAFEKIFSEKNAQLGHYTIKVDPLACKKLLHQFKFYYCDTLLEAYCNPKNFIFYEDKDVDVTNAESLDLILSTIENTFQYDRYHRDFNIENNLADKRYKNWMVQMFKTNQIYELRYKKDYVGFIACNQEKMVLQAVEKNFRQRKLGKFLWSIMCQQLFSKGYSEITSSISAANLPIVNLFASLGFRFRTPIDIYHRMDP